MHVFRLLEHRCGCRTEGRLKQTAVSHPLLQGVGDGARLLVDFLEHEVRILTLVGGIGRQLALAHGPLRCRALTIEDPHGRPANLGDITFLEKHEPPCHRQ